MAVVTILGAGMMGSALALPLVERSHEVRLVGTHLDGEIIASLAKNLLHPKLALELPSAVRPFFVEDLGEAMDGAEVIALGVSSAGVRWAGEKLTPFVRRGTPIAMVSKGLEWNGAELVVLPDVLRESLPSETRDHIHPVGITGPCIAGELARCVPSCVVFSGRDAATNERIASVFRGSFYHVWTSTDVVGHEACAALKNAYAMGIAFAIGLHERAGGTPGSVAHHNYESAVFAQAAVEMRRVVEWMGGEVESVLGLSGVGDLDVTTNGGRTGRFGRWLGLGIGVDAAVEKMEGATLECLDILRVMRAAVAALEARGELGSGELPLLRHLAEVVFDGASVNVPFGEFFGGVR